jgi:hypothetical protein
MRGWQKWAATLTATDLCPLPSRICWKPDLPQSTLHRHTRRQFTLAGERSDGFEVIDDLVGRQECR